MSRQVGFTLLETLLAVLILGFLLVGFDAGHRLLRRWTPRGVGQRPLPVPRSDQVELLTEVDRIDFAYWSPERPTVWQDHWSGQAMPALIRLRLTFRSRDGRRWPDIVMAPMRRRS